MRSVWIVARRELKALFDHPTGYILLVVFLVVNNFLFFRQAYLVGLASLRPMLDLLPWVLLFLVPAATMRALAEDIRSGTLEVVLAQPLTEVQLLAGKYVGQVLFLWSALALTLPVAIGLGLGADLHVGVMIAQYVGAALLVAGLTAVGVWASSVTHNQITAFILGVAVMFPLILIGLNPLIVGLPLALSQVAQSLAVLSHFENIARGVIDLRDAVYFVTLAGVFLTLAYVALMRRKLSHGGPALRRLQLGTALIGSALVVVNLFGRNIGGRLDLTPNNAYTLSAATKNILRGLDDIVTIKLFVSDELPTQIAGDKRDVEDLLRDFRSAGGDNVRVVRFTPADDPDAEAEARQIGIPAVQFNVYGETDFQIKSGYFGLAVQYADGTEAIPFIERTSDLEYRLVAAIRTLTRQDTPVVALAAQTNPEDPRGGFQVLRQALQQNYEVRSVDAADSQSLDDDVDVVVLAGSPMFLTDSQVRVYDAFLRRGGGALIMANGTQTQQQLMAQSFPPAWNRVLEPYGVAIRTDMAYDLTSNEAVSVPSGVGGFRVLVNYPFWMRVLSTREAVINRDVEALVMPWASTIDTSDAVAGTVTPLFVTSRAGGRESGRIMLMPQREFPEDSLGRQLISALVNPAAESDTALPAGRVVVVGNSDFVADRMVQSGGASIQFVLNAVDWLAQDDALIAIRAKDRTPPPLLFESTTLRDVVKYGNVLGVPILLILVAALRLLRRRRLSHRPYVPATAI